MELFHQEWPVLECIIRNLIMWMPYRVILIEKNGKSSIEFFGIPKQLLIVKINLLLIFFIENLWVNFFP